MDQNWERKEVFILTESFQSICETIMNLLYRQKEAEALRERMEREKRELQEFIGNIIWIPHFRSLMYTFLDKDNKRKADQMAAETEERQRKEEELKKRLQEAQEVLYCSLLMIIMHWYGIIYKGKWKRHYSIV